MKKALLIGFIIFISGLVGWLGFNQYMNSYVPYMPVVHVPEHGLQKAPSLNTPEHQENIRLVLSVQRSIKWKIRDGKVMFQRKMLTGDANLNSLWELTTNAEDPDFMIQFSDYKEYERRAIKKYNEALRELEELKEN